MSHGESLLLALVGIALIVAGLTVVLGPWALVGSGVVLIVVALLIPEKERREPVVDASPPRIG